MTKQTRKTYGCPKCGGTITEITREIFANESSSPIRTTVETSCPGCQRCRIGERHECEHILALSKSR